MPSLSERDTHSVAHTHTEQGQKNLTWLALFAVWVGALWLWQLPMWCGARLDTSHGHLPLFLCLVPASTPASGGARCTEPFSGSLAQADRPLGGGWFQLPQRPFWYYETYLLMVSLLSWVFLLLPRPSEAALPPFWLHQPAYALGFRGSRQALWGSWTRLLLEGASGGPSTSDISFHRDPLYQS